MRSLKSVKIITKKTEKKETPKKKKPNTEVNT